MFLVTQSICIVLAKSLFELNDGGRLAYIIPTEFMNLDYGDILRRQLCNNGYLTKIIMFNIENKSTLLIAPLPLRALF